MGPQLIISLVLLGVFILLMRLFGAWMLRINEVIHELRVIKEILGENLTEEQKEKVNQRFS